MRFVNRYIMLDNSNNLDDLTLKPMEELLHSSAYEENLLWLSISPVMFIAKEYYKYDCIRVYITCFLLMFTTS